MEDQEFNNSLSKEYKYFDNLFFEFAGENSSISLENYKEIVLSYNKFNRNIVSNQLDKLRKRLRETSSSTFETDLLIS